MGISKRIFYRFVSPGNSPKKCLANGGLSIALVGADGAGKSSLVSALRKWLGWKLSVRVFYMGSKKPSLLTNLTWGPAFISRQLSRRILVPIFGKQTMLGRLFNHFNEFWQGLFAVATALDRYARFQRGVRAANNGDIVLYDRFPLEAIKTVMDGPKLQEHPGRLLGWLARLEMRLYDGIRKPDHVFVLHVSPHVSQQRKPDHDHNVVVDKITAVASLKQSEDERLLHIDADEPFDTVLLKSKQLLWKLM